MIAMKYIILIIVLIILINIFNFTNAQSYCTYMKLAYENGKRYSKRMELFGNDLRKQGFIVKDGHPADKFFQESPLNDEISNLYKKSTTLLYIHKMFNKLYFPNKYYESLTNEQKLQSLKYYTDCVPMEDRCRYNNGTIKCDPNFKYRNCPGFCNNIEYPDRGVAFSSFNTILQPCFDDGIYTIRKSFKNRNNLPEPRIISNALVNRKQVFFKLPSDKYLANFFAIMFGQYLAHDLALRNLVQPEYGGSAIQCCAHDYKNELPTHLQHPACAPMKIPNNDRFHSKHNITCQNFIRSQTVLLNNCDLGITKQVNIVSHFLDNSNIYGSTVNRIKNLRSYKFGQLLINKNNVLPEMNNCKNDDCYFTGDNRVNQTPMLALIHSLLLRLHNHVAIQLSKVNTNWTDEQLFYETKRICIALYQHIVYEEWLPLFLGEQYCKNRQLISNSNKQLYCGKYDNKLDPSTFNEFSHGSLRLFHSYIPSQVNLIGKDEQLIKVFNLSDVVNKPKLLLKQNYDDLVRGLLFSKMNFGTYSEELRNKLFKGDNPNGIDLLSFDIQRGRDHGICPYHKYYEICKLNKIITKWDDLNEVFANDNLKILQNLYESVFDIDLFVGVALEQKLNDDYFGTVGKCIIGTQFFNSKFGDRYFYSFDDGPYVFKKEQIHEIRKFNVAKLLCSLTNVEKVATKAFVMPSEDNKIIKCSDIKSLDLSPWYNN